MADRVFSGEVARFGFEVLDLNGAAVTGLAASDFTITLTRRTSSNFASASETVTVTETGGGTYVASFTPGSDCNGYTYRLLLVEKNTISLSMLARHEFYATAHANAVDYTETDAYCSLDDVAAQCGRNSFSTASPPTTSQVTDVMAWRAAEITALARRLGLQISPPSGSHDIGTATDDDLALGRLCRLANAVGAAADALMMAEARDSGDISQRAQVLFARWTALMESISAVIVGSQMVQRAWTCNSTYATAETDIVQLSDVEF